MKHTVESKNYYPTVISSLEIQRKTWKSQWLKKNHIIILLDFFDLIQTVVQNYKYSVTCLQPNVHSKLSLKLSRVIRYSYIVTMYKKKIAKSHNIWTEHKTHLFIESFCYCYYFLKWSKVILLSGIVYNTASLKNFIMIIFLA